MGPLLKLGFLSSNEGKYDLIARLVATDPALELIPLEMPTDHIVEGDSSEDNSKRKALSGSFTIRVPVLATDEEMMLSGVDEKRQPRAEIKRIIGESPTDDEMIEYYSRLIASVRGSQCLATITTYYSIALQGQLLGTTSLSRDCLMQLPASSTRLKGRPLSALHYLPRFGKRYSELTQSEQQTFERATDQALIMFIKSCFARTRLLRTSE